MSKKNTKPNKQRSTEISWKNWGDHPIVVTITVLASLVAIIAFVGGLVNYFSPQIGTATPTLSTQSLSSPDEVLVNKEVTWGNNTFRVKSIHFGQDNLVITFTFDIQNAAYDIQTCPLPQVTKSGYGNLEPVRGGGIFDESSGRLSNSGENCRFITLVNGQPTGWAEYRFIPTTFEKSGVYSVKIETNSYAPSIVFEIK